MRSVYITVVRALALLAAGASTRVIPPRPVYVPAYTPQFLPADGVTFYPNYAISVFAGTGNSQLQVVNTSWAIHANGSLLQPTNKTAGYYPTAIFQPISGGQKLFANEAKFTGVYGLTGNNITGDVFITDFCIIRRVNAQGIITVFAGSFEEQVRSTYYDDIFIQDKQHSCGFTDNVAALQAKFNYPYGIATDMDGNLYVADTENLRIRKVAIAAGTNQTTTVAGSDTGVELHENQQALISHIGYVVTIAAHGRTLYFVHRDLEIWRLDLASLLVTRVLAVGGGGGGGFQVNPFGSLHATADTSSLLFTWTSDTNAGLSRLDLTNANKVTVLRNATNGTASFLSVTGDLFNNYYYFVQESAGASQIKICSIYFHKQDENKEFLVAGGTTCGASSVGQSSLQSSLLPGYFMYVNRYADLLWAQHYQEQYAEQPFYMAGVMSLTLTQPSSQPTSSPSVQPSSRPTSQPSRRPTGQPSRRPTGQPSKRPTVQPSGRPTNQPSSEPSRQPTNKPSSQPTKRPSSRPTNEPTLQPSADPSAQPSTQPSINPSTQPTGQPTSMPTLDSSHSHSLQVGVVVGVVMGSLAVFGVVLMALHFGKSKCSKKERKVFTTADV